MRPETVSEMTQKFVRLSCDGCGLEREPLLDDNQEELDAQEWKLRRDILKVLRADAEYSRDEFEDIIAALQRLGVKNTRHFKHLEIEDLTGQGVPVVTARKLMDIFGDKDDTPKGTEDAFQKEEPMSSWEKIWAVVTHPTVLAVLGIGVKLLRSSWEKIWAVVTHPTVLAVLGIGVELLRRFVLKV